MKCNKGTEVIYHNMLAVQQNCLYHGVSYHGVNSRDRFGSKIFIILLLLALLVSYGNYKYYITARMERYQARLSGYMATEFKIYSNLMFDLGQKILPFVIQKNTAAIGAALRDCENILYRLNTRYMLYPAKITWVDIGSHNYIIGALGALREEDLAADEDYYKTALNEEITIVFSRPYISSIIADAWMIHVGRGIFDQQNRFYGQIDMQFSVPKLLQALQYQNADSLFGFQLINRGGDILLDSSSSTASGVNLLAPQQPPTTNNILQLKTCWLADGEYGINVILDNRQASYMFFIILAKNITIAVVLYIMFLVANYKLQSVLYKRFLLVYKIKDRYIRSKQRIFSKNWGLSSAADCFSVEDGEFAAIIQQREAKIARLQRQIQFIYAEKTQLAGKIHEAAILAESLAEQQHLSRKLSENYLHILDKMQKQLSVVISNTSDTEYDERVAYNMRKLLDNVYQKIDDLSIMRTVIRQNDRLDIAIIINKVIALNAYAGHKKKIIIEVEYLAAIKACTGCELRIIQILSSMLFYVIDNAPRDSAVKFSIALQTIDDKDYLRLCLTDKGFEYKNYATKYKTCDLFDARCGGGWQRLQKFLPLDNIDVQHSYNANQGNSIAVILPYNIYVADHNIDKPIDNLYYL